MPTAEDQDNIDQAHNEMMAALAEARVAHHLAVQTAWGDEFAVAKANRARTAAERTARERFRLAVWRASQGGWHPDNPAPSPKETAETVVSHEEVNHG